MSAACWQTPALAQSATVARGDVENGPAAQPAGKSAASSGAAQMGDVSGTVLDTNGDLIPGATVVLHAEGTGESRAITASDSGFFEFSNLKPGVRYHITVSAKGFVDWNSEDIACKAGEFVELGGIKLALPAAVSSVTVYSSTEQIAVEQVQLAEEQRVLGIFPNFYVVYDSQNAVPLSARLKFQMAYRVSIDPVTFVGAAAMAGINQAGNTPNYVQGAKGYGQRFGASYADEVTDIMFGGAILPTLLHQDPRYYYQGTGTFRSRAFHALSYPFVCKGDNGHLQPNYSTIGGDLFSAAISNAYYPQSNRGASLVYENVAIGTAERALSTFAQEFIFRKFTPKAK